MIITFVIVAFGITSNYSERPKEKSNSNITYMERYNEYIDALGYLEYKMEQVRVSGVAVAYEGEFKEMWERTENLCSIAFNESTNEPSLFLPMIPKVCWYCQCMMYGCAKFVACGCTTGLRCGRCPWCGGIVIAWTNGTPCNGPYDCYNPCLN